MADRRGRIWPEKENRMQAHLFVSRLRLAQAIMAIALALHLVPALGVDNVTAKSAPGDRVAWLYGGSEQAVDAAFARAKSAAKPVLLYWGASWCPPCNQLKATLFNRRDFIALTRALIPVYLDGDLPGAQKQGSRFRVVGYPTLIIFSSAGAEITRLPGEADAARIVAAMQTALAGGRSASAVLADARAGNVLSASEWQALAFYSWETDEAKLAPREQRSAVLCELAGRSQAISADASSRLWLKSLMAQGRASTPAPEVCAALPEQVERLLGLLRDPEAIRRNADVIIEGAAPMVRALTEASGDERVRLLAEYAGALAGLQNDARLSRADRTGALIARVELTRLERGVADTAVDVPLPAPLVEEVRALARRMDAEIKNGFERQAVITSVAHLLAEAGLWLESDALLKANLRKIHAPYYLMSQLGSNARKQGRKAEALKWYERAYQASKGPATRLQWGASYVAALVDLGPQEGARIEKAATTLLADAAKDKDAFYERSGRSLRRVTGKLLSWNAAGEHADELQRVRARHRDVCLGIAVADPRRQLCEGLWPDGMTDIASPQ